MFETLDLAAHRRPTPTADDPRWARADGALSGYRRGVQRERRLIDLERAA